MRKLPLPPIYFLGALGCMVILHYTAPLSRWVTWPAKAFGIVVILVGIGLAMYAHRQCVRANTTVMPNELSSALMTDGVFGFTRNPMYLGMVFVLLGIWICLGTLSSVFVVPIFVWFMTKLIRIEEASLKEQFKEAYETYCGRVRRWI